MDGNRRTETGEGSRKALPTGSWLVDNQEKDFCNPRVLCVTLLKESVAATILLHSLLMSRRIYE